MNLLKKYIDTPYEAIMAIRRKNFKLGKCCG